MNFKIYFCVLWICFFCYGISVLAVKSNDQKCSKNNELYCLNSTTGLDDCIMLSSFCKQNVFCENFGLIENSMIQGFCSNYEYTKYKSPFKCGEFTLSNEMVCNGIPECPNGEDEHISICSNDKCEFLCKSQQCTHKKYICDGIAHCIDGSDESSCALNSTKNNCIYEYLGICLEKPFTPTIECSNKAIDCDSIKNCIDGSDEWPSLCQNRNCSDGGYFKCAWNGACIEPARFCDGIVDCADSSDEVNCTDSSVTTDRMFHCGFKCTINNICLYEQQLCDRVNDCVDGEDEKTCNYTLCSNKLRLCGNDSNVICKTAPNYTFKCECKSGYVYDEKDKSCKDINECDLGKCSQKCTNTNGSYKCSCDDDYWLQYGHCVLNSTITSSKSLNLLISDQNRLLNLFVPSNHIEVLFELGKSQSRISSFDLAYDKNLFFFTSIASSSIYVRETQLKIQKELLDTYDHVNSTWNKHEYHHILLAYDWIHRNLYFTANSSVYVVGPILGLNLSDRLNVKLILKNVFEPRSLVISPSHKVICWNDWSHGTIECANLDGTERRLLVRDLQRPSSLYFDLTDSRLYWTDDTHDVILTCDLNGNNLYLTNYKISKRPMSLVSFGGHFYYMSNNNKLSINNGTKETLQKLPKLLQNDNENLIRVYNEHTQPLMAVSLCQCGKYCLCIPKGNFAYNQTECICNPSESKKLVAPLIESSKNIRFILVAVSVGVVVFAVISMVIFRQVIRKRRREYSNKKVILIYRAKETIHTDIPYKASLLENDLYNQTQHYCIEENVYQEV